MNFIYIHTAHLHSFQYRDNLFIAVGSRSTNCIEVASVPFYTQREDLRLKRTRYSKKIILHFRLREAVRFRVASLNRVRITRKLVAFPRALRLALCPGFRSLAFIYHAHRPLRACMR